MVRRWLRPLRAASGKLPVSDWPNSVFPDQIRQTRGLARIKLLLVALTLLILAPPWTLSLSSVFLKPVLALAIWSLWRRTGISTLGTLMCVAELGILVFASHILYQLDCSMSLGFIAVPLVAGSLVIVFVASASFAMANSEGARRRYNIFGFLVAFFVIPAVFLVVVFPLTVRQRRLRHIEEMGERMPILRTISDAVVASAEDSGNIPADEGEFCDLLCSREWDPNRLLGCCWVIDYRKIKSNHFKLIYSAMDVEYVYDSATPERGWSTMRP